MDAVFILFCCSVRSKRARWTVHFHKPIYLGPTVSASLFLQERLRLHEVQSLKTKESWKKFNKKTENGYLSGLLCPAAHKQKSLLPVSVTALIQAQTDPIAEDLPASCRPGQPWPEGGFSAAPASRGSPLYRYTCQQFLCTLGTMIHRHCWNAVLSRLLDPNFWCVLFLFQKVFVWYKLKKSNMYIFPQISEKNRILVGC